MHIRIDIYPEPASKTNKAWSYYISDLQNRITDSMMNAIVNYDSAAIGMTTLLANDDSGVIVATIDIRRK